MLLSLQVMSAVYGGIATRLNDAENHRTQSEFEDSLISKTFIFQVRRLTHPAMATYLMTLSPPPPPKLHEPLAF